MEVNRRIPGAARDKRLFCHGAERLPEKPTFIRDHRMKLSAGGHGKLQTSGH